jgi:hypothetical protein
LEVFAMLAIAVFIFVLGIVLAIAAGYATRNFERGRGGIVVAAFFSPFLFVGYLLVADHFRDEFHRARGEAFDDGFKTLPLANAYRLSYFYKMPWMSVITKVGVNHSSNSAVDQVQLLAIVGNRVFGETGRTEMLDGPPDFFFSLDLSSGELRKFSNEAELRSNFSVFGQLQRPEEVYQDALKRQRSDYFWPAVMSAPLALLTSILYFVRHVRKTKPALEKSNAGS